MNNKVRLYRNPSIVFPKNASHSFFQEGEENKRGRRSGRHLNALPALDESSSGSRDDSRASSIEHDDTTRYVEMKLAKLLNSLH